MPQAYRDADFIIISTPTNYDRSKLLRHLLRRSVIEEVLKINREATIIIKSTVPVGFTIRPQKIQHLQHPFQPEFPREGHALYDNLYPSRIIVGPRR
ncbi:MAG: hypothetical protein ACLUOI_17120 [Eisenbergiella sp.]